MMASTPTETVTPTEQSSPPTLRELARRTARMIMLPYIIGYVTRAAPSSLNRDVVVIVNPRTRSMTIIESDNVDLEAFKGPLPASKASIDAMPVVEVDEDGLECAICLAEFDVGGEAKEMPCKHRYHVGCIEKWLGMRGSCPMCRYSMPVEEEGSTNTEVEDDDADDNDDAEAEAQADAGEQDEEEGEGEGEGEEGARPPTFAFRVYFASRRVRRRHAYSETETDPDWNSSRSGETGDQNSGASTQGMEMDGQPTSTAQDMDTDDSIS